MEARPDFIHPPLHPRQVHVWRFSLAADASALAACWSALSADERQRAERFAFPALRRRFVVTRANLRHLLGHYAGVAADALQFSYGPNGKPQLVNNGLHFNLSHSGEQGLIALSCDGPLGIDLEMIRPLDYESVAREVFTPADLATLRQACSETKADVFFTLWVRHEARVKAEGSSIETPANTPTYDLELGPEYRGAVATAIENVRINMFSQSN